MRAEQGKTNWANFLWGNFARSGYLWLAAALLLLMMLGGRELWTQEHRWADIVSGMFFRHDFLHPYLGSNDYYDKPLLSYWLIVLVSLISQDLNTWVLRLPSALAGLFAVWSIYRLGTVLKNKSFGLLCGWLLLTTFYFVFWARISSADMLNLAGALFAVTWYFEKRAENKSFNYVIFFLILALTSLCKGLGGAVVAVLAVLPDLLHEHRWKKHLHWRLLPALLPALAVYVFPFWLSSHVDGNSYGQNGLYLVYRENILRYFQPFDHKDPIYTYFIFLPVYLLPWTLFFIPALFSLPRRFQTLNWNSRWMVWSLSLLFLFFTLSGSRRSYYVLPIVPFAILMTADWLYTWMADNQTRLRWAGRAVLGFFFAFFLFFGILQPAYYTHGGHRAFVSELEKETQKMPAHWQYVLLDPESKIVFYLHLPPQIALLGATGERVTQTPESLAKMWPVVKQDNQNLIFITRKHYVAALQPLLPHHRLLTATKTFEEEFFHKEDPNATVAFIPVKI